ncbi:hypothetical protein [Sandaracinus amylolyticus]|uniref:Uncharacterized protein n=1 Tax=Sandaracinus amylolyticus TaxID=927083 RepID=A0A0F6W456_9BACT|nr:hypothetical protein [Sandaracinus amylolyticus]AKF06821.1 hypothetical protein DB32_003970 [Sandaracinus amylolyticus]
MRRAGLAALVCALIACQEPQHEDAPIVGSLPRAEGPLDALSRRHARLRERMVARGYEERSPTARVFVIEDRGVVLPLDLEVGSCTTFVALASSALRDLRLTLYDREGEEAARDDVSGEGGLVHVCPDREPGGGRDAPFYLAIEARDGTGSVSIAEMHSQVGEGDGFEGLFDDVLAPRVPFPDVEARLAETRSALRARGLSPVDAPRVEWVGEGGALRMPMRFEGGQCYVATARGGAGTRDVDLFLFDPGGVEVGRDLGTDAEPTVEHCPEASGLFIVEARAFEGEGAIGVMVLAAPAAGFARQEPEEIAGALDAERSEAAAPDVALGVLAAELAARGFSAPVFASRDASIAPGETRMHEVVAGPGCALIVASASHAGMDVDLYLADATGRELDADTAMHATARVRACRAEATVLRVAVKAYGRDGRYALAVLGAPAAITGVQGLRLEEATAGPRARGYVEIERFAASLADSTPFSRDVVIPAGRCIAIAAAGAEGVDDVDLFLRDPTGALVASEAGPSSHATVSRCAGELETPLRLEAIAGDGGGEVQFAILEGGAP